MTEFSESKTAKANMRIWDEVFQVEKKYTEPIKDGRGLTAIAPMSLIMQATKLWGPIGKGWGFEIIKDGFVYLNSPSRPEDALHIMTIKLWYHGCAVTGKSYGDGELVDIVMDGTYGMGCTKLFQIRGGKPYIDDDFNKSTLTDAITNALSRLGFGGSVRLGEMQSKYTTNLDARDSELEKALSDAVAWKLKRWDPDVSVTEAEIVSVLVEELEANSRSPQNPEHIRAHIRALEEKEKPKD